MKRCGWILVVCIAGCGDSNGPSADGMDASTAARDASAVDSGTGLDGGLPPDTGLAYDSGVGSEDAPAHDAPPSVDASPSPRDAGVDAGPPPRPACTTGAYCDGTALVQCVAGTNQRTECDLVCTEEGGLARCALTFLPSNLPSDVCARGVSGERRILGVEALNVDDASSCDFVVDNPDSPSICVVLASNFSIAPEGVLNVRGARAVAIVATDTLRIEGVIDASATGSVSGPGGGASEARGATSTTMDSGGGGGGHRHVGGGGGLGLDDDTGREVYRPGGARIGAASIEPLIGGGRGGDHLTLDFGTTGGGGGGGAIQLVGCGRLELGANARITANGGGGGGGQAGRLISGSIVVYTGGAGGGAGGAVLLESPNLACQAGALVTANGGAGGGAGGGVPRGETIDYLSGEPGEDGPVATRAARGGAPPLGGYGDGYGGNGGARDVPEPGVPVPHAYGGGGGGGSSGRVRLNDRGGDACAVGSFSPPPARGEIHAR